MRKIRKVIADSIISYYDRDGVTQTFHTTGNVRTVEMAVKVLMDAGIVNVLVDDITVNKNVYVMDVETFIEHAKRVDTDVTGYQETPWLYGVYGEAMRQYTSSGRVPGYAGRLDLNYFRGERGQWDAYAHGDGANVSVAETNAGGNVLQSACVAVASGDTLSGIAERTGMLPWQSWHGYGSGNPGVIYPGETVCYGGGVAAQSNVARTYTVVSGDNLWAVFGSDWARVASLNGLSNPSLIYPGQILRY